MTRRNSRVPKDNLSYLLCLRRGKKFIKELNPIRLTNTEYKVNAIVFAKKLQNVLSSIINENRKAYMKLYIGENARLFLNIFYFSNTEMKMVCYCF